MQKNSWIKGYTFKSQKDVSGFGDIKVFEQSYDKRWNAYIWICLCINNIQYIVCAANTSFWLGCFW